MTPVNLISEVRLQKAFRLLKSNKFKTISEVRFEIGMENASYFSKKFVDRFGVKPGEVD
jgi:AraC-like DNA-binding protein